MDSKEFSADAPGKLKKIKGSTPDSVAFAFVPDKLPPKIEYDLELTNLLAQAESSIGKLSSAGRFLPNPHLLISPYMKQEAVLSSKIEGTQASLSDYFLYEATKNEPKGDIGIKEIENYIAAANEALAALKTEKISIALIQHIHRTLLKGVRGEKLIPGELRGAQNWIGPHKCKIEDATFVPSPPTELFELLEDLEDFIGNSGKYKDIRPLIQCALIHYQFETIHPFFDGNGRIGRLLVLLFLCEKGLLSQPLLYLSAYFERNRTEYYHKLRSVSMKNDWTNWLKFFLQGVAVQSDIATKVSEKVMDLEKEYYLKLQKMKIGNLKTHTLMEQLFVNPFITIPKAQEVLKVSFPTAKAHIEILEKIGALKQVEVKDSKGQVYLAEKLFKTIMQEE
jgi:Fic family protein